MGIVRIAWELGFYRGVRVWRVNPRDVVDALKAAGVQFRSRTAWNAVSDKLILTHHPHPAVLAELAAWQRYVAYVRVMLDRHRRKHGNRKLWRHDHKAQYLAALWREARVKRDQIARQPRKRIQRKHANNLLVHRQATISPSQPSATAS